jgi:outer membrane lipoprotein-sorting protein
MEVRTLLQGMPGKEDHLRPCVATVRFHRYGMMKIRTAAVAAALAFAAAISGTPSKAQTATAGASSQAADIARIETYLNGLTTAQADFTFASPDGSISRGVFFLSRPSKLRFEYTEPKGNLLIADGSYVIYWDAAQKDASNLPISSTPLSFLLKDHISLTDGLKVSRFEHAAGVIRISLAEAKGDADGTVTVAFSDQPLELKGWRLVDGQGQTTDVTFANMKLGGSLDPALFHFDAPHQGKRGR